MSVAPVSKVHIFVHSGRKAGLLSALQEAGLVHLEEAKFEGIDLRRRAADASEADRTLARLKHALDVFASMDETPGLKRLFRPKPELSLKDQGRGAGPRPRARPRRAGTARIRKERPRAERPAISTGKPTSSSPSGTSPCRSRPSAARGRPRSGSSSSPPPKTAKLEEKAAEGPFWFEVVSRDKRACRVVVVFPRESADEAEALLEELGAEPVDLDARVEAAGPGETIEDLLAANRLERDRKASAAKDLEAGIRALAVHAPVLMPVYDVLMNEREMLLAGRLPGDTESRELRRRLGEGGGQGAPGEEGRRGLRRRPGLFPRTASRRGAAGLPGESAGRPAVRDHHEPLRASRARAISTPRSRWRRSSSSTSGSASARRATASWSTLLSLLYLKLARPRGGAKQFAMLALYLGISNIILGTLFGGWFGFPIKSLLLIDALKDPIPFLGLSLGLGFIQVWFGTLLSMIERAQEQGLPGIHLRQGRLARPPARRSSSTS